MPSVAEIPKAFDTSLYKSLPEHVRKAVMAEDLAGWFLEAGAIDLVERINPRELKIVKGFVYDPIRQENVNSRWQGGNKLADLEASGAENFYNHLLQGRVVISISPMGGISKYKESRINVAHLVDVQTIHYYGIPSQFSQDDCWQLAWRLNDYSQGEFNPQNIDDLRALPISISFQHGTKLWDFLNETAQIDSNAWTDIKEGNPWARKEAARQKANEVVKAAEPMVVRARSGYDYIRAGAFMETSMQRAVGWRLSSWSCPGILNSQLIFELPQLGDLSGPAVPGFAIDVFGNIRQIEVSADSDEKGSLKFNCPACKSENTRPRGGYVYKCQNENCPNPDAVRC